jgi:hypothetical protein
MSIRTETQAALLAVIVAVAKAIFLVTVTVKGVVVCHSQFELLVLGLLTLVASLALGSTTTITSLIVGRKLPTPDHDFITWPAVIDGLGAMVLGIIGAAETWCAVTGNRDLLPGIGFPGPGF